jgi:hypothetical protein
MDWKEEQMNLGSDESKECGGRNTWTELKKKGQNSEEIDQRYRKW